MKESEKCSNLGNVSIKSKEVREQKPLLENVGHWKVTAELIDKIKAKDIKAMTQFYEDNYKTLASMARNFVYIQKCLCCHTSYTFDDCMQQAFVDMPYWNFSTRSNLFFSIKYRTFLHSLSGGILSRYDSHISINNNYYYESPIKGSLDEDSGTYVLDRLASAPNTVDELIDEEDRNMKDTKVLHYLEHVIKNKKDLNAMFCKLFTDLKDNEVQGGEYEFFKKCQSSSCQ